MKTKITSILLGTTLLVRSATATPPDSQRQAAIRAAQTAVQMQQQAAAYALWLYWYTVKSPIGVGLTSVLTTEQTAGPATSSSPNQINP